MLTGLLWGSYQWCIIKRALSVQFKLAHDKLVIVAGAEPLTFGIKGVKEHAFVSSWSVSCSRNKEETSA
jgi:NADH dehydrogenase FAD-containing subunit